MKEDMKDQEKIIPRALQEVLKRTSLLSQDPRSPFKDEDKEMCLDTLVENYGHRELAEMVSKLLPMMEEAGKMVGQGRAEVQKLERLVTIQSDKIKQMIDMRIQ